MRMSAILLSALLLGVFSQTGYAWDCDSRCPDYQKCLDEKNRRNLVGEALDPKISSSHKLRRSNDNEKFHNATVLTTTDQRILRSPEGFKFNVKMYWKEGYCWQAEWRERRWCLQCEGGSCGDGDELLLKTCSGSSKQKFVYAGVSGTNGGKLKPFTRQDLCWTRTGNRLFQLKSCGGGYRDELGRDKQIIIGVELEGSFEMHPNGRNDECLDNDHHPKSDEVIGGDSCDRARNDRTSRWQLIDKQLINGGGSGGDGGGGGGGSGGGSNQVTFRGSEYCDSNDCGLCEGDCDSDNQCAGSLVCFQRGANQRVPGCSGGEGDSSETDYCVAP